MAFFLVRTIYLCPLEQDKSAPWPAGRPLLAASTAGDGTAGTAHVEAARERNYPRAAQLPRAEAQCARIRAQLKTRVSLFIEVARGALCLTFPGRPRRSTRRRRRRWRKTDNVPPQKVVVALPAPPVCSETHSGLARAGAAANRLDDHGTARHGTARSIPGGRPTSTRTRRNLPSLGPHTNSTTLIKLSAASRRRRRWGCCAPRVWRRCVVRARHSVRVCVYECACVCHALTQTRAHTAAQTQRVQSNSRNP